MAEQAAKGQDAFLDEACRDRTPLTIFLVTGIRLQGILTSHDRFCLLLERDGHPQLVYKHAISSLGLSSDFPSSRTVEQRPAEQRAPVIVERRSRGGPMR